MPKGGHRIGAGRPGRSVKVEDCRRLDIRDFLRAGMLPGPWLGSWQWRDPRSKRLIAEIRVRATANSVQLSYRCGRADIHELVALTKTTCTFGGHRYWFKCQGCNRRVAILLLRGQHFRCRRCHDLRYLSQTEDSIGRALLAQAKLERRLGLNLRRPKGMHHSTRDRILARIFALEERGDTLLAESLKALLEHALAL